ncbi:MAG: AraC family transcriptional regulator [Candidatus Obscuribacterales bacterium]|nr:AraC family transcriptional regulator [Candidatus Obscuribacterales bacterium]
MDILSDTLDSLQFTGSIYCKAEFTAPWGLRFDGANGHAGFIFVVRGSCYADFDGLGHSLTLTGGDFIMVPKCSGYVFKSGNDAEIVPISQFPQPGDDEKVIKFGGGGAMTTAIMGCITFDTMAKNPLVDSLPEYIYVKAEQLQSEPWLEMTLRLIVSEISGNKPGSIIAISRLTDLLFIHTLRFSIGQSKDCPSTIGFLKAISDPQIGLALALIHEKPQAPWTVSSLAEAANLSRSSFAVKFAALTGKTPLEYVTSWRMNKAQQLLKEGSQNLAKIAVDVGYQSEAAFSKAFRRETGLAPGSFRRQNDPDYSYLAGATSSSP